MNKKIIFGLLVVVVFVFIGVREVKSASSITEETMLTSVTVLDNPVLKSDNFHFVLIDETNMTEDEIYVLPDVDEHDGEIYVIKMTASGPNPQTFTINAQEGDILEATYYMYSKGEYFQFYADGERDTWWLIGRGNTN